MQAATGFSIAAIALSWIAPAAAGGVTRIGFALAVAAGAALGFWLYRREKPAWSFVIFWAGLMLWTLLAGVICSLSPESPAIGRWLEAGLLVVMTTAGLALPDYVSGQAGTGRWRWSGAAREKLALAQAGYFVWDWDYRAGKMTLDPELARQLAPGEDALNSQGLTGWLDALHPDDRAAHITVIDDMNDAPEGEFRQDLRLRGADGSYRRYRLHAQALYDDRAVVVRLIGLISPLPASGAAEDEPGTAAHAAGLAVSHRQLLLTDRLGCALERLRAGQSATVYLLLIDVDCSGLLLRDGGAEAEEDVLTAVSQRLESFAGQAYAVTRLRHDRFAVICESADKTWDAARSVRTLQTTLSAPVSLGGRSFGLAVNIGAAAAESRDPGAVMADATLALYEARNRGRNAVAFSTSVIGTGETGLSVRAQALRRALTKREIEVWYRPIATTQDQQAAGFEAVLRWRHPQSGVLEPELFIRIAEDCNLIAELGAFLITQATQQLSVWRRFFPGGKELFMMIDVVSAHWLGETMAGQLRQALARRTLPATAVRLAIPERLMLRDPAVWRRFLAGRQSLDAGLCYGDFGRGYASLSCLRRFPFDSVRIDVSPARESDAKATGAFFRLAREMTLQTIAEGVGTREQLAGLAERGCVYAQGPAIGPAADMSKTMALIGALTSPSRLRNAPRVAPSTPPQGREGRILNGRDDGLRKLEQVRKVLRSQTAPPRP